MLWVEKRLQRKTATLRPKSVHIGVHAHLFWVVLPVIVWTVVDFLPLVKAEGSAVALRRVSIPKGLPHSAEGCPRSGLPWVNGPPNLQQL